VLVTIDNIFIDARSKYESGIIQYHDRICRGRESNRTTPAVSQMNCNERTWNNYTK